MDFVELKLQIPAEFTDILIAELAEIGYDSFVDTPEGVDAYITEDQFAEASLQDLIRKYQALTDIEYQFNRLEKQNWNETWEKSYEPINVDDVCLVRAAFHPADDRFKYQIVITPKMSFGTGHHETTSMMLSTQLGIDHQGKKVLDVGCGTGILAIMACLLGAKEVLGFDIDEWAVENTRENIGLNHCDFMTVSQGTIENVDPSLRFDIILANINRNVLLQEIPVYRRFLSPGGKLLVSGFYEHDIEDIARTAEEAGLKKMSQRIKNQWACVVFQSG
jgi:ribosomal protein L11 methyltransferase